MNISLETHRNIYIELEDASEFLKKIKSVKRDYVVNFHVYSEIKNEKELLCVESFLATQDLEKSKLFLWSDYDVSNNEFLKPYKNYINFRIYDPIKESKGTPLENCTELLLQRDERYYLNSDLFRLLICYKYGGCFVDMDIVFLRNLDPLLENEFLYMWGSELDFENYGCCGTMMNLKKESDLARLFLEELKITKITPMSTCWGLSLFASVYRKKSFQVLPGFFFNTEWNMASPLSKDLEKNIQLNKTIQSQWFTSPLENNDHLFLEAFTWHWHNTSNGKKPVVRGSKFEILQSLIRSKLKQKQII
jgi:hypothetical protein